MKQFLLTGALFLCSILSTFAQFSGSGSGTESDPYLIFYADQLTQVRNNLGKDGVYFKLMADIDLGDWLNDNSPSEGWQPIGVEGARFKGIFDGDGHTISNISIKRASTDNVGFFGYTDGATIKNLTINGDITGQNSVGGVVGTGLNTTITGVHYVGKVTGAEKVGGLIGWLTSSSTLKDCSLQGDVKGAKDVGGIVGGTDDLRNTHSNLQCNGTVTATGDNCGGIFGSLAGIDIELKECTTNATIQGHDYVGGIIGYAESLPFKSIEKCNSIITLLGNNYVGGILGGNDIVTPNLHKGRWRNYDPGLGTYISEYYKDEIISQYLSSSFISNCCIISRSLVGNKCVGGIAGNVYYGYAVASSVKELCTYYDDVKVEDFKTFYKYGQNTLAISNCYFNGDIQGTENVGGISGWQDAGDITKSYANATILGKTNVGGIVGEMTCSAATASITSNSTMNRLVSASESNVGRIYGKLSGAVTVGAQGSAADNYALVSTRVVKSGVVQDVQDGAQHGTTTGLSALKLKANYVAKGWDFNNDWAIQETETFPYKPWQAAPPYISSDLTSKATTISGKSIDGGKVYLRIGDDYTASTECNGNDWSFTVPALQSGVTVEIYAVADGKSQSPYNIAEVGFPGKGTEADPYLVYTAEDLQGVYKKGYYKLMNDVNLTSWINSNSPTEGWKAIGKTGISAIHFDGGGFKVSGLWVKSDNDYNGLFSNFPSGSIRNLTVETATGKEVNGKDYTGILAGRIQNTSLQNITVKGDAEGSVHTGGIAGAMEQTTVRDVTFDGNVSSATDNAYVGGLTGWVDGGTISASKTTGNITATGAKAIVGGLLGQSSAAVSACYAGGTVKADTQDNVYAGGLIGINGEGGTVSDCYATASTASSLYGAGLVAYNFGSVSNSYATGNVQSKYYGAGLVGYNDGGKATVTKCLAANPRIDVTDKSGWTIRVLGGFKNGAATPANDNYALKDMALSVNGVPKKASDNILDGIAKEQAQLRNKAFYTGLGWDFLKTWGLSSSDTYPHLLPFDIIGYDLGDVNRDKEINVVDVIDIARYVVGTPSDYFTYLLADINSDDKVNVTDAVSLVNNIAGDVNYVSSAKSMVSYAADDKIALLANGRQLSLNLEGSTAFTACQFDLNVPSAMLDAALSSIRSNGHTLLYNKLEDGRYRVVVISTSNAKFKNTQGVLLTMTLDGAASAGTVSDVHFVTPEGVDHTFSAINATTVTEIENINNATQNEGSWYNVQGMKVKSPKHGVYIHNGKKIILK